MAQPDSDTMIGLPLEAQIAQIQPSGATHWVPLGTLARIVLRPQRLKRFVDDRVQLTYLC